jgi:RNA polymerase sigma-70 factor (ECF subfamily)
VRVAADATPPAVEDPRLVRSAQRGDPEARAELVERYWERVYRWLYRLTRDRHAAEDMAQETFLKAFAHLDRFRAGTNFGAWVFRIAHNNYANHCRAAGRRRPLPDELAEELADAGSGPEEEAQGRETLRQLAGALDRLAPDFRAPLLLRAEEGLSFREIADVLGTTEETARWRVFKARQKLLRDLAPRPEPETP